MRRIINNHAFNYGWALVLEFWTKSQIYPHFYPGRLMCGLGVAEQSYAEFMWYFELRSGLCPMADKALAMQSLAL